MRDDIDSRLLQAGKLRDGRFLLLSPLDEANPDQRHAETGSAGRESRPPHLR
jgi:hypothetical protein